MLTRQEAAETPRLQLITLVMFVAIAGAGVCLWWLHQLVPAKPVQTDMVIGMFRPYVAPKHAEQFVFLALGLLAPLAAYALTLTWSGSFRRFERGQIWLRRLLPLVMIGLLFGPLAGSDLLRTILGKYGVAHSRSLQAFLAACLGAIVGTGLLIWVRRKRALHPSGWGSYVALVLYVCTVALQVSAWRVAGIASVSEDGVWSTHADPIAYAVSQVVAGKTLLVDLPSQYGLYPELLAPLFKLIGLSLFNLTAVFAVMQVVSLLCLYGVLARLIHIRVIRLLAGISLVMVTFETVLYFAKIQERYFQYWPIRFFWPAVSVLAFYYFARKKTLLGAGVMSLLGAVAILWNFDSGLFVSLAFAAYLVARPVTSLLRRERAWSDGWTGRRFVTAIGLHIVITVVVIGAFVGALVLKAHEGLNLFWTFQYQRVFYDLGLMMLPLPPSFHPWVSVLGIYLAALLTAVYAWRYGVPKVRHDVLFFLAMLGLGLFVYYEGRSHVLNLVTVCWPALLIAAIIGDVMLRAVRARLVSSWQACLPAAVLAGFLLAAGSFVARVPDMARDATTRFANRGIPTAPFVQSELALIRRHAPPGDQCWILSARQGILYAESGLASPVRGPGLVETLLQVEWDQVLNTLMSGTVDCVFYGVGKSDAGLHVPMSRLLERYVVEDQNAEQTLLLLRPKR